MEQSSTSKINLPNKGLGKAVKAHTKQAKMLKGAINGGSKKGNGKKA